METSEERKARLAKGLAAIVVEMTQVEWFRACHLVEKEYGTVKSMVRLDDADRLADALQEKWR